MDNVHERRALPEGWESKGLGEILELIRNGISTKQNEEKEGYPVTRIETISKGKINREKIGYVREDYNTILKYKMISGDILFSHINSAEHIGKTAIFENESDELYQGVNLLLLRPNKGIVFPKYLLFYLKEPEVRKYFETRCKKAVNQASLNQKDIIQIKIPLPPLPTQRGIVSILEKAEETKKLRAQADELTDRLLQSVFMEMFGDPVRNTKGWDVKKIEDIIISIEAGWSVNGEQRPLKEDELGVLKVSAVTRGVFLSSENKAISKSQILKKVINPEKGDLLFSRANTRELVGATCLIDKNYPNLLLPDKLWKIKPDKKQLISEYFKFILSNPAIRKIISSNATGTSGSMYNISMNKLKSISIPIPPLPLQQKFARIVEKIESMRQSHNQSKQQIEDLFSALMQKAFRGELEAEGTHSTVKNI